MNIRRIFFGLALLMVVGTTSSCRKEVGVDQYPEFICVWYGSKPNYSGEIEYYNMDIGPESGDYVKHIPSEILEKENGIVRVSADEKRLYIRKMKFTIDTWPWSIGDTTHFMTLNGVDYTCD